MSDSGSPGMNRGYRSNSHSNLNPGSFMSPMAAKNNALSDFSNNMMNVPQTQAKTQDRRFDRINPTQYSNLHDEPTQMGSFMQRRHKTPNEISSGGQNPNMMMPKSSSNIGAALKQQPRIQKYPGGGPRIGDGSPNYFRN